MPPKRQKAKNNKIDTKRRRTKSPSPKASTSFEFNKKETKTNNKPKSNESNNEYKELQFKIRDLNPFQTNWVIIARAINKKPIYSWKNEKSNGKLFSFDLLDDSGQIRVTAFNSHVDKFFDKIENNKVYCISKIDLKEANKKFANISNNFELNITNDTKIKLCEKDEIVPVMNYNYSSISKIKNMVKNSLIHTYGICYEIRSIEEFSAKSTGKTFKKRDIIIIDKNNDTITVTLWNNDADHFDENNLRSVITIINGKVNEYNDKISISMTRESVMSFDKDIEEKKQLKKWFEEKNHTLIHEELTKNKTSGKKVLTNSQIQRCISIIFVL